MPDHARHGALFERLIRTRSGDGSRPDSAAAPAITPALADRLEPLRGRPDLEVVSLSVNGDRVDVVARDDDDEWRVVFGTPDGERVEWLDVYRRPEVFGGVDGGLAVVINGPSSVGKSSVLREIRVRSAAPWVIFDEPFVGSVGVEWLIWREQAEVLHRGFLDGIGAVARAGNLVATAAGGHPQVWFDDAFTGVRTVRVGLDCPSDELARRERRRSDVPGGLSEADPHIHAGWDYHVRVDTAVTDVGAIADEVLALVDQF